MKPKKNPMKGKSNAKSTPNWRKESNNWNSILCRGRLLVSEFRKFFFLLLSFGFFSRHSRFFFFFLKISPHFSQINNSASQQDQQQTDFATPAQLLIKKKIDERNKELEEIKKKYSQRTESVEELHKRLVEGVKKIPGQKKSSKKRLFF